jgi:hypothetical protein
MQKKNKSPHINLGAFLWMIACKWALKNKHSRNFAEYRTMGIF